MSSPNCTVASVQQMLNDVRAYSGPVDGVWNNGARNSVLALTYLRNYWQAYNGSDKGDPPDYLENIPSNYNWDTDWDEPCIERFTPIANQSDADAALLAAKYWIDYAKVRVTSTIQWDNIAIQIVHYLNTEQTWDYYQLVKDATQLANSALALVEQIYDDLLRLHGLGLWDVIVNKLPQLMNSALSTDDTLDTAEFYTRVLLGLLDTTYESELSFSLGLTITDLTTDFGNTGITFSTEISNISDLVLDTTYESELSFSLGLTITDLIITDFGNTGITFSLGLAITDLIITDFGNTGITFSTEISNISDLVIQLPINFVFSPNLSTILDLMPGMATDISLSNSLDTITDYAIADYAILDMDNPTNGLEIAYFTLQYGLKFITNLELTWN